MKKNEHGLTIKWQEVMDRLLADPKRDWVKAYRTVYFKASMRTAKARVSLLSKEPAVIKYLATHG
jgi:hypothetical protein